MVTRARNCILFFFSLRADFLDMGFVLASGEI